MHPGTLLEQAEVQASIDSLYDTLSNDTLTQLRLQRRMHITYLLRGLERMSVAYLSLDASRPWLCYWILHSLDLLDHKLTIEQQERAILTISECQHPEGGFGGGPKQLPHLACTFAAISALAIIGTTAAYETIHRQNLFKFLSKMKQPNGSFTVHEDGESDVRGSYCAIAVANLTNILTAELQNETANFLIKCQNYEGGFGAVPGAEAHAGYTYCALAALIILEGVKPESIESLDLHSLDRFAVLSQCEGAGGFRGRTNKLVDGCYSFWAGALFPMIRRLAPASYFDVAALQKYILVCCQNGVTGGLCDKPGKSEDYYHTCYCLSGLAVAQRETVDLPEEGGELEGGVVVGDADNLLHSVRPEHNLIPSRVTSIQQYFKRP